MKYLNNFRFGLIALLLIVFISFFSCQEPTDSTPKNTNTLSGVLVDEQGVPVPSAIIDINSATSAVQSIIAKDTTDEDGNFYIKELPEDISKLTVDVTHQDFKLFSTNLTDFKSKTSTPVHILHQDTCTGVINLRTFKQSDSTNLSDVEVRLFRNGSLIRKALTKDGALVFANVCGGTYIARFFRMGYGLVYDSLIVHENDTLSRHYYMHATQDDSCCHGTLTVTPMDSSTQQSLVGATVSLYYGSNLLNSYKYQHDPITFTGLCPGQFKVHIEMTGYSGVGIAVTMKCNDSVSITRALQKAPAQDSCCNGIYKVFLIDKSTGKAPTHAPTVTMSLNGKVLQTITPTGGYVYFQKLCEGTFQMKITSSFYKEMTWDYTSVCNKFDTTTKYLDPIHGADSCCNGKITVAVKDSTDGTPLDSVYVKLMKGGTVLTYLITQHGAVTFTGICPGDYSISYFAKSGYNTPNPASWSFTMGCNDTVYFHKTLLKLAHQDTCCKGIYKISVIDKGTGKAPAYPPTITMSLNGKVLQSIVATNGMVYFQKLCEGTYQMKISSPHYTTHTWDYTSVCNKVDTITKYLDPIAGADTCCHGKISLAVRDSLSNAPIDSVTVYLSKDGTKINYGMTSHGIITFTGICPGNYSLYYTSKTGYTRPDPATWNFTMECNDTAIYNRTLIKNAADTCCNGIISGTLTDSTSGHPIAQAGVALYLGSTKIGIVYTDSLGKFQFAHLCPGSYDLKISASGYNPKSMAIKAGCNDVSNKLSIGLTKK